MARDDHSQRDAYVKRIIKMRKTRFFLFYVSAVLIIASVFFFIYKQAIAVGFNTSSNVIVVISVCLMLASLGIILNYYLTYGAIRLPDNYYQRQMEDVTSLFSRHLSKNIIEKYGNADERYIYDEKEREEEKNRQKLFLNDIEDIKTKFLSQFTYDLKYTKAFEDLYSLEQKITNQILRLISNSNLNLILGTLTTLIGVLILGISILQKTPFTNSIELLSHYIPRLSTVILIEIFAFFFLRLYRKNLDEIKYFQNEISNLNFKISSLKASLILDDKESATRVIAEFSKVERNYILRKDETTEKLEIEKLEKQNTTNVLERISNIISSIKK